jgi:hypothetical protein
LWVGEIREYPLRGLDDNVLGDNVLTLRHSVPRFSIRAHFARHFRRALNAAFSCTA